MPEETAELDPEIAAVVKEARGSFDLKARLQGRALREGSVTLYTDDVLGDRLGDAQDHDIKNVLGIVTDHVKVHYGVLGALADLPVADESDDPETVAERAKLEAERDSIIAELDKSALVVKLRALPPIVIEDARRKAKAALDIKGKVPEAREEEFNRSHNLHLLASAIVSIEDRATDSIITDVSVEDAANLTAYLPQSEYVRLSDKLREVLFRNTVAESVTAQADF